MAESGFLTTEEEPQVGGEKEEENRSSVGGADEDRSPVVDTHAGMVTMATDGATRMPARPRTRVAARRPLQKRHSMPQLLVRPSFSRQVSQANLAVPAHVAFGRAQTAPSTIARLTSGLGGRATVTMEGREQWWRSTLRATPDAYTLPSFIDDSLGKHPRTAVFRAPPRECALGGEHGNTLLPGRYEVADGVDEMQRIPATYNFNATKRRASGTPSVGYQDKDIHTSPGDYQHQETIPIYREAKHRWGVFKSESRRLPTPHTHAHAHVSYAPPATPGPGAYNLPSAFPAPPPRTRTSSVAQVGLGSRGTRRVSTAKPQRSPVSPHTNVAVDCERSVFGSNSSKRTQPAAFGSRTARFTTRVPGPGSYTPPVMTLPLFVKRQRAEFVRTRGLAVEPRV